MNFCRLLLTVLLIHNFYYVNGVNENDIFSDTKLNGSGLYYEPISNLQVSSETFELMIHVNILVYFEKYNHINTLFNSNVDLCKNKNQNISKTFQPILLNTHQELIKRFNNLDSLQKGTRVKRGLINAIGEFQD